MEDGVNHHFLRNLNERLLSFSKAYNFLDYSKKNRFEQYMNYDKIKVIVLE